MDNAYIHACMNMYLGSYFSFLYFFPFSFSFGLCCFSCLCLCVCRASVILFIDGLTDYWLLTGY